MMFSYFNKTHRILRKSAAMLFDALDTSSNSKIISSKEDLKSLLFQIGIQEHSKIKGLGISFKCLSLELISLLIAIELENKILSEFEKTIQTLPIVSSLQNYVFFIRNLKTEDELIICECEKVSSFLKDAYSKHDTTTINWDAKQLYEITSHLNHS